MSKKTLRPYQLKMLEDITKAFVTSRHIVMAMCPNAGKTYTTICIIKNTLKQGLHKKVLILAHGTKVLRTQFTEALQEAEDFPFTFCEFTAENKQWDTDIVVALPQGFRNMSEETLSSFDLVIVDEAHERFLADDSQKMMKKINAKNILLLTGTPSKFIGKKKYDKFHVAMSDMDIEHFANVQVIIGTSAFDIKNGDYTKDFNINEKHSSRIFNEKDTRITMDRLLDAIMKVLKMKKVGQSDNFFKLYFNELGKTMIICNSIDQANYVGKYLEEKEVNSLISESKGDKDSENIAIFKEDSSCKILIVVNRAILGFNLPELQNVVDLSGTESINRLYQSFSRLTRTFKGLQKRFIKMAPKHMASYTEYNMAAMLSLTHRDNIIRYNGKNFLNDVPIFINKKTKKAVGITVVNPDKRDSITSMLEKVTVLNQEIKKETKAEIIIEKEEVVKKLERKVQKKRESYSRKQNKKEYDGLDTIDLFTRLYSNPDKALQIYSKTNLHDVQLKLGMRINESWTYEKCKVAFEEGGCSNLKQFQKYKCGAHDWLYLNKLVDVFYKDMNINRRVKWDLVECKRAYIEGKCSKISHLEKYKNGAYKWLCKNKLVNKFCIEVGLGLERNSKRSIMCVETGETYKSTRECGEAMNITYKGISSVLRGRQKSTGGYTFKYVDETGEEDE